MTKKTTKKTSRKIVKKAPKAKSSQEKNKAIEAFSDDLEALLAKHGIKTYSFGGVVGATSGLILGQGDTNDLLRLNSIALNQILESK